jgi:predicted secreted Zn-dependent protease
MAAPRPFTPARLALGLAAACLHTLAGGTARAEDAPLVLSELSLPGGVHVHSQSVDYELNGGDANDLARQMGLRGQAAASGPWSASTRWQFTTGYRYETLGGGLCRAQPDSVQVTLDLSFDFPHWSAPAEADPDLVDDWSRFDDALHAHEDGHRQIAVQAATELASALASLPPASSCQSFEEAAQGLTTSLLDRHARDQAAYDGRTLHGLTQGAVFP